jgi:CubicO group peptidase (beta-lactamase class C family)
MTTLRSSCVSRRGFLIGASALLSPVVGKSVPPAWAAKPPSATRIAALLRKYKVPAVSFATFDRDGIVLCAAHGRRQSDSAKATIETRFQAASLSKTVNALCVLSLVRDGRLSLDDPVNKRLTGWRLTGKDAENVTIRMLLSHTGGTTIGGFPGYQRDDFIPRLDEILDGVRPANTRRIEVIGPVGKYRYSGGGVVVLQKLMTEMEAASYEEIVARRVLEPLGMSNSSMRQPLQSIKGRLASGHTIDGDVIRMDYFIYPEMAAAGLWTTPGDLARMLMAMLDSAEGREGAFLPETLAREMMTPVQADAGLGVFINPKGLVHHDGANWGFRAVYFIDPRTRRGKIVMANGQRGDMVYNDLLKRL